MKDPKTVKPTTEKDEQIDRHVRVNNEYMKRKWEDLGINQVIDSLDKINKRTAKKIHKNEIKYKSKLDYVITLFSKFVKANAAWLPARLALI